MITKWTYRENETDQGVEYLGVDYGAMDFVLVNAIQELNSKLTSATSEMATAVLNQNDEIEQLKTDNAALQIKLNELQLLIMQLVEQQNSGR